MRRMQQTSQGFREEFVLVPTYCLHQTRPKISTCMSGSGTGETRQSSRPQDHQDLSFFHVVTQSRQDYTRSRGPYNMYSYVQRGKQWKTLQNSIQSTTFLCDPYRRGQLGCPHKLDSYRSTKKVREKQTVTVYLSRLQSFIPSRL